MVQVGDGPTLLLGSGDGGLTLLREIETVKSSDEAPSTFAQVMQSSPGKEGEA